VDILVSTEVIALRELSNPVEIYAYELVAVEVELPRDGRCLQDEGMAASGGLLLGR